MRAAVALGLVATALLVAPAPAAVPGGNGPIVYTCQTDELPEGICVSDAAGARVLSRGADFEPAVSPDGKRIAFARAVGSVRELFTMALDGTDVRQVTHGGDSRDPAWSPDGARLAFGLDGGIAVVDADGGTPRPLLTHARFPAWSPDGASLAFVADREPGSYYCPNDACLSPWELYVARADGTGVRRVGPVDRDFGSPDWSPDGRRIAAGCRAGVCVVDVAAGTVRAAWSSPQFGGQGLSVSWSPDGTAIAFARGYRPAQVSILHPATGRVDDLVLGTDPSWVAGSGGPGPYAIPPTAGLRVARRMPRRRLLRSGLGGRLRCSVPCTATLRLTAVPAGRRLASARVGAGPFRLRLDRRPRGAQAVRLTARVTLGTRVVVLRRAIGLRD